MSRRVLVYGPAYLDRVLRVDGPLVDPSQGGPLDRSMEARGLSGDGSSLRLVDSRGSILEIEPPPLWPGPGGSLRLAGALVTPGGWSRQVRGTDWLDDLGGMGAGYAKALNGVLVSALGAESDPMSTRIRDLMDEAAVINRPVRVPDRAADWTLLVTSGASGDKLPIGFRGCHAALSELSTPASLDLDPDVIVAAGLGNALVEPIFRAAPNAVRVWAPSLRCLTDSSFPASRLAGLVDVMACNREEWAALEDREALEESVWVRSVTHGPRGAH
ncbi:MAG TPA: sugar kinase, partial [Isosphaeraceae bacterium]|nr:sugar kinase [Isosphaeraceae bacterium]